MDAASNELFFRVKSTREKKIFDNELSIEKDEILSLEDRSKVYVKVKNKNGDDGFVPLSFLTCIKSDASCENLVKKIYALVHHPYSPSMSDELEISIGDIISISIISADGWAYGTLDQNSGWFPINFVTPIFNDFQSYKQPLTLLQPSNLVKEYSKSASSINIDQTMTEEDFKRVLRPWEGYEWYYGSISTAECNKILNDHGEIGDFLIRSRSDGRSLTIVVKTKEKNRSYLIGIGKDCFVHANKTNKSLRKIIDIYSDQPIGYCSDNTPIFLVKSIKRLPS